MSKTNLLFICTGTRNFCLDPAVSLNERRGGKTERSRPARTVVYGPYRFAIPARLSAMKAIICANATIASFIVTLRPAARF